MINVLVLMSGPSMGFKEAGYAYPKNLVEIAGAPLVQRVLLHLEPLRELGAHFICVLPHDENELNHTGAVINLVDPTATVIELNGNTAGAACSALLAIEHINNDGPLIIVNGDQVLDTDLRAAVRSFQERQLDGGIIVFEDIHPRWSFVKCSPDGRVIEAAEKRPISKLATAGFYYFREGRAFVKAATEMIQKDANVNGRFYVCPVYNEMILRQQDVGVHMVARAAYRSLATPADVAAYSTHLQERLA